MMAYTTRLYYLLKYKILRFREAAHLFVKRYWFRAALFGLALWFVQEREISIDLDLKAAQGSSLSFSSDAPEPDDTAWPEAPQPMNTSLLVSHKPVPAAPSAPKLNKPAKKPQAHKPAAKDDNLANSFSNLAFSSDKGLTDAQRAAKAAKRKKQLAYAKLHAPIAKEEMKKYGIPASIKLAQGLLESNVGESALAQRNQNHFGIKCFSRTCSKGHCRNFTDDTHKDFFRVYKSVKDSYRAHSLLLKGNKRYKGLFELRRSDYKGWAKELKAAGYATDKRYAEKLVEMIEDLELYTYDE